MHRRLLGLVHAAPEVSAGDHKAKELHVAPRVNEMMDTYMEEVQSPDSLLNKHRVPPWKC